jgi:LPXTG-site transpeptidase (sortase) family protein
MSKLKRILLVIFVVVLIAGGIYLILPFAPAISYAVNPPDNKISYAVSEKTLEAMGTQKNSRDLPIPKENRLIIPKIGVDAEIFNAPDLSVLNTHEGVWHEAGSRNPAIPGTTVIAGHRFQYRPPNTATFYNLDKLQVGDKILIFWSKLAYTYTITKTYETYPQNSEPVRRENPNTPPKLSLYTCTPLGVKRIVVEALQDVASE